MLHIATALPIRTAHIAHNTTTVATRTDHLHTEIITVMATTTVPTHGTAAMATHSTTRASLVASRTVTQVLLGCLLPRRPAILNHLRLAATDINLPKATSRSELTSLQEYRSRPVTRIDPMEVASDVGTMDLSLHASPGIIDVVGVVVPEAGIEALSSASRLLTGPCWTSAKLGTRLSTRTSM